MITATSRLRQYAGNGIATVFPFPYYFFEATDLQVIDTVEGVDTTLTLGVHYTISGMGVEAGGAVTMLIAPSNGHILTIVSNIPETQLQNYVKDDNFPAEAHEAALDRLTALVQQLHQIASRSLRIPLTNAVAGELSKPARSGKVLGFDTNGNVQFFIPGGETLPSGLEWVAAPATSISAGTAGAVAYDDNYFYLCVATNVWRRTPITDW